MNWSAQSPTIPRAGRRSALSEALPTAWAVDLLAASDTLLALSPVATLLAAIVVAVITAKTTNARQERQLGAEGERQEPALRHERELADLHDLRALLDEWALALNTAGDVAHRLVLYDDEQSLTDGQAQGKALVALHARLEVRLGKEDPIAVQFGEGSRRMFEAWRIAIRPPEEVMSERIDRHEMREEAAKGIVTTLKAFLVAAIERRGTSPLRIGGATAVERGR